MSLSYYEATLKFKNRRKCTYQIILLRSYYNVFKNFSYNKHPNTFVSSVRSKLRRYLEIEQVTYQNTNMFYKVRSNLSRASSYSRIVSHELLRTHFPETCESPELLLREAFNLLTCFTQPSMLHDIPTCFFHCMCTYAFVSRVSRVIVFDLPPIDLLLPMPR